jgi:hypothetical protein
MKLLCFFLTATAASALTDPLDQPGRSAEHSGAEGFSAVVETGWFNRYLLEGREAFGDSGVFSGLVSMSWSAFAMELWVGFADHSADREFVGSLLYAVPGAPLDLTLGISHITDMRGGEKDRDFSVGAGDELFLGLEWTAAFTYGVSRSGGYLETGIFRTFAFNDLEATLGSHLGSNFGYVQEGHPGPDHFAIRLEIARSFSEAFTLKMATAHHTPIRANELKHPDDGELFRGFHFGISGEYSF